MSEKTEKTHFSEDEVILYDAEGHLLTPMHDVANLLPALNALVERARQIYERTSRLREKTRKTG